MLCCDAHGTQETGEHLAIQFLSKHTMHSDVAIEVAYSGEFFVRPLRRRRGKDSEVSHGDAGANPESETDQHHVHAQEPVAASGSAPPPPLQHELLADDPDRAASTGEHDRESDPHPAHYELVIDNDSGTYRPRSDLLPTLHAWLAAPQNLGALGRVTCVDAFDERQKRWKEERAKVKEGAGGKATARAKGVQVSAGSRTSSSVSGVSGDVGSGVEGGEGEGEEQVRVTKEDMLKAVEEDAKRARENEDTDRGVQEEEKIEEKLKADPDKAD